jgi:hypothetical protein
MKTVTFDLACWCGKKSKITMTLDQMVEYNLGLIQLPEEVERMINGQCPECWEKKTRRREVPLP